jgi:thioesterase domain-containing protein
MAAHYLKEIRELQPQGPYYLGGFCMGGQVAFEMAQRLRQEGQSIALLVMIDTYNFNGVELRLSLAGRVSHLRQKTGFHLSNFARLGLKEKLAYLGKKFQGAWNREFEKASVKASNLRRLGQAKEGGPPPEVFIEHLNDRAYFAYVAKDYPGPVTIFKPQRNYAYLTDPENGWGGVVTGGLEFISLPVDPGGIFIEPYVKSLADQLQARLDQAAGSEERVATAKAPAASAESVLV